MSSVHPWDRLPSMLLVLDAHGQARQANRAFVRFSGHSVQEVLRDGWRAAFSPSSAEALVEQLDAGGDFTLQLRMRRDGRDAWVDCAAAWQADTAEYVCVFHDVSAERDAELSARSQAELFRLLADNLPVLIAYYEASEFRCMFANRRYAQTFGFDAQGIIGKTNAEIIGAEAAAEILPRVTRMLQEREPIAYERQISSPAGAPRWLDVNMLPHIDAEARAAGAFVLITDITRRRLGEQALRESEDRLAKFMQATAEGILFHKEGIVIDVNPPLAHLLGYTLEEVRGRQALDFVAPEHVARAMAVMASNRDTSYESVVVDRNGIHIPVELIVRSMTRNGEHLRMVIVRDIRDRQASQARIAHLAHHDSLTGLPNRPSFMDQLQQLLVSSREADAHLALLFIDLDHFKQVNDTLGHQAGDKLLQTVAARLKESLRTTDLVARFGGDEFVVLLHDMSRTEDVERVVRKLLTLLEVAVEGGPQPISVTPSIGVALRPAHGNTADELIRRADIAMYQAKAAGRAGSRFFEPAMEAAADGSVRHAVNPPAHGASGDGARPAGN